MKYEEVKTNPKQFRGVTGLSISDFEALSPDFEQEWMSWLRQYTLNGKPRRRRYSPKSDQVPQSSDELLFFILVYLKNNMLQETMAAIFNMKQDMVNKLIHILHPILQKALKKSAPISEVSRIDEVIKEGEYLALDATEQRVQRDTHDQETYYSGKKKPTQ